MPFPTDALGSFAGATGVGALFLLGVFLILDGRAPNLFPTVEVLAKTSTWGIVATVPILAISYLIGLFLLTGGSNVVQLIFGPATGADFADLARLSDLDLGKSVLAQEFSQLRQQSAVLAGSSFALIVVALGALSERRNLVNLAGIIRSAAYAVFILAAALFYFAGAKSKAAHCLAQASVHIPAVNPVPPSR
jgi:hypothetical protein